MMEANINQFLSNELLKVANDYEKAKDAFDKAKATLFDIKDGFKYAISIGGDVTKCNNAYVATLLLSSKTDFEFDSACLYTNNEELRMHIHNEIAREQFVDGSKTKRNVYAFDQMHIYNKPMWREFGGEDGEDDKFEEK